MSEHVKSPSASHSPPVFKQTAVLPLTVGKAILRLIGNLPDDVGKQWLTMSELRDVIITAGIDADITLEHIQYLLQRHNREGAVTKTFYGHNNTNSPVPYYRHSKHSTDTGTPLDDHYSEHGRPLRHALRYPPQKYFQQQSECEDDLYDVNEWLLEGYLQVLEADHLSTKAAEAAAKRKADEDAALVAPKYGGGRTVGDDGFCSTHIGLRRNFVAVASEHAGSCGEGAKVRCVASVGHGTAIEEVYQCTLCRRVYDEHTGTWMSAVEGNEAGVASFRTCEWKTTKASARSASTSRAQPETNVRLIKSAREVGVNLAKARDLVTGQGIICMTYRNMEIQDTKMRTIADSLSESRLRENRRKHCAAVRSDESYQGDIIWIKDRETRNTARGAISIDGGGLTRAYNHRIKGSQAAFIVFSLAVNLPIALEHTQVSCVHCTLALNKAKKEGKVNSSANLATHMRHPGKPCYRNSKAGPASSEEVSAEPAALSLLLGPRGSYVGDDEAIFADVVVSDNDTRASTKFIETQHAVMGDAVSGIAEHVPDIGHVIKTISNAFYKIRDTDPSFRGKGLLETSRIRAMMGDVRRALFDYSKNVGDDSKRKECNKIIGAIVPHHCGDHSGCCDKVCLYLQLKRDNPTWTTDEVALEYAKKSRFNGRSMSLSERGAAVLKKALFSRIDVKNLDRVAQMASSNSAELFFGRTVVRSEGKRLNLDHTDVWRMMLFMTICSCGNEEKYREEYSEALGIDFTEVEKKASANRGKKRSREKERFASPKAKQARIEAKFTLGVRRGKDDPKAKHKSGKMSLKKSSRVKPKKASSGEKAESKCASCGQPGHGQNQCDIPAENKYGAGLRLGRVPKDDMPELIEWPGTLCAAAGRVPKEDQPELLEW